VAVCGLSYSNLFIIVTLNMPALLLCETSQQITHLMTVDSYHGAIKKTHSSYRKFTEVSAEGSRKGSWECRINV
jgi:hypothetical protein